MLLQLLWGVWDCEEGMGRDGDDGDGGGGGSCGGDVGDDC